jgi:2-succinyl-6-hydroxy-2,4-cyclohexadiene-1-carboxylate synthase
MPLGEVHTVTLHGHGPDWRAQVSTDFEDELRRIAQSLRALPAPHLVCGYSLGARVSLGLLVHYPELFQAAVLIGVHPGLADAAKRAERRATDSKRAEMLCTEGLDAFVDSWETLPMFATQRRLDAGILRAQREQRLSHEAQGLASSLRTLGLAQMPDYMPVTLMAGALDPKFVGIARSMVEQLPAGRLEVVEDTGHNLPLEAPNSVALALREAELRATAAK